MNATATKPGYKTTEFWLSLLATLLAASAWSGGCVRTRTVLVPPGEPVQLVEPVRAHVYIEVAGKMDLPEEKTPAPYRKSNSSKYP